jgi:hypothetical protein
MAIDLWSINGRISILLLSFFYFSLPSVSSAPTLLSPHTPRPKKIGVYTAIGVSIVIFSAIVFWLGMRRGRTGTWYCWRNDLSPMDSPAHAARTCSGQNANNSHSMTSTTTVDFEKQNVDPNALAQGCPHLQHPHARGRPHTATASMTGTGPSRLRRPEPPFVITGPAELSSRTPERAPASPARPRRGVFELPGKTVVHEMGDGIGHGRWSRINAAAAAAARGGRRSESTNPSASSSVEKGERGSRPSGSRPSAAGKSSLHEMDTVEPDVYNRPLPPPPLRTAESMLSVLANAGSARGSADSGPAGPSRVRREDAVGGGGAGAREREGSVMMDWEGLEWLRAWWRERGSNVSRVSWRNDSRSEVDMPVSRGRG